MTQLTFEHVLANIPAARGRLRNGLAQLSRDFQDRIARASQLLHVAPGSPGHVVAREGGKSEGVGVVLDGALGMVKTMPGNRAHVMGLLLPGDGYGHFFQGTHGYRIEALTGAKLLRCERSTIEELMGAMPELERLFMVSILDDLDAAREWVMVLNGTRVAQRVASFLLILARRNVLDGVAEGVAPIRVQLPVRRAALAQCLGIRPESLSRALHRLARQGLITQDAEDCWDILDVEGLVERSGQDLALWPRDGSWVRLHG